MPSNEEIANVAYQLWRDRDRTDGSAEDDWYQAERQLTRLQSGDRVNEALEESFPASDPPANHAPDIPAVNASAKWAAAAEGKRGEVTIEREGRQYGAIYVLQHGMMEMKTHTESRSIEIGDQVPEELARRVLEEIVVAGNKKIA